MTEINPFAPRWENSVKEKMHSCFSTSGSWMASESLKGKICCQKLGEEEAAKGEEWFSRKGEKKIIINSSSMGGEGHLWGPVVFSAHHWVFFTRKWAVVYWYCHITGSKTSSRIKRIARRSGIWSEGQLLPFRKGHWLLIVRMKRSVEWWLKSKQRGGSRNQNGKPAQQDKPAVYLQPEHLSVVLSLPGLWRQLAQGWEFAKEICGLGGCLGIIRRRGEM